MSGHSPGPWFVYEANGWSNNVANWGGHIATCENEEDAPFIAAAPETAAELERAQETIAELLKVLTQVRGGLDAMAAEGLVAEGTYEYVNAAIAKAEAPHG